MGRESGEIHPERENIREGRRQGQLVAFSEVVTTFFFLDDEEALAPVVRQGTSLTKVFDGRSDVMRSQIEWSEIEDFLIRSSSTTVEETKLGRRRQRDRSYAQHWDEEEGAASESTIDDDDDQQEYAKMIMMMERFPCDADLF